VSNWLLTWIGRLPEKELAMSMMMLYQMWMARNDAREKEMIEDPRVTSRRTVALVEEWDEVNCRPSQLDRPRVVEHWQPPPEGWIKVNTDGSFRQGSG
jgi:hypothetical protein